MPRVKIDYIVSFSSEDLDNPASNLLNWEVSKKRWLCTKGEPSCSVVLQLSKAVKISAIHIGAHNAAFVEVLAGRSEKPNEPYQVLLASSVFLSPGESRAVGAGVGAGAGAGERVRSFPAAQLVGGVGGAATQRWDRLRVVCAQPYNKHCKYGLNFVQIYEPEPPPDVAAPAPALTHVEEDDDDEFKPGELFAAHNSSADTGSQIRQATSQALKNMSDFSTKLVKTPIIKNKHSGHYNEDCSTDRRRSCLMYTEDDDKPHAKIDHIVQRHKDDKFKQESSSSKKDKHTVSGNDNFNKKKSKMDNHYKKEKTNDEKSDDEKLVKNVKKTIISNDNKREDINNEFIRSDKNQKDEAESCRKIEHVKKAYSDKESAFGTGSLASSRNETRGDMDEPSMLRSVETGLGEENSKPKKRARDKREKDVGGVLAGVELSLSGYVHPERGELRDLALRMGARVHRHWGPRCNLLVCAFADTPKLRVARAGGGGRVRCVRGEWLREAARLATQPPWRPYAAHPADAAPPTTTTPTPPTSEPSDESDTDDEIEKVLRSQKRPRVDPAPSSPHPRSDDGDTDHDDRELRSPAVESIDPNKALPAIFAGRTFLVRAAPPLRALMQRYVRAYAGLVLQEEDLEADSEVDYVLDAGGGGNGAALPPLATVRPPSWLWRKHRTARPH